MSGSERAPSRAEICVVACAEAWRGDGAILASPMGLIPTLGARLAQYTFAPDLLVTDGEAMLIAPDGSAANSGAANSGAANSGAANSGAAGGTPEGWLPYRDVLRLVATGRRHVMMGAAQLDRQGNQNISCIGDWARPRAQLLGVRGAPGNTINHPVSYWIPRHSPRVFVPRVDMVSGVGYDRAAAVGGRGAAFHELRVVVTNLAVLDFQTPTRVMRLRSVHPGVTAADVVEATGFPLAVPDEVAVTRLPTPDELDLLRNRLDPAGRRGQELPEHEQPEPRRPDLKRPERGRPEGDRPERDQPEGDRSEREPPQRAAT
jgi:acyl CoA:acetate/3-ketoacid CoA transferase beta subunit